ncbi:MAG: hypothetical protein RXO36_05150 [Candidatus Nanopusillus acidilobi]|jgi:hypothetical protein
MEYRVRQVLKDVLNDLYEIGKDINREELEKQVQELTGIKQSHFIHTPTTKDRYERALMRFCDYLEEQGIIRDNHLNSKSTDQLEQIIDSYFKWLASKGFSENTIKIHIVAIGKTLVLLRPDIRNFLLNNERRVNWWIAGKSSKKGDSYADPEKIRENLKEKHRIIAEVQALTGFLVRELTKISVDEEKYEITVNNAKNGKSRTLYFEYRKEKFHKLVELIEKIDKEDYDKKLKDYYYDLWIACKTTEQSYNASYPFRYEYIQKRFQELMKNKEELKYLLEKYSASEEIKKCVDNNEKIYSAIDFVIACELGYDSVDTPRYYYRYYR